jgi:hypothetical protein
MLKKLAEERKLTVASESVSAKATSTGSGESVTEIAL